jgi:3-oxoacyl-[acyl-carrier-protein] synthase-1
LSSLCITSLGMVSAVGRDVVTTCASVRAGIRRPSELGHAAVIDEDTDEAVPVVGYPMRGFSDGFIAAGTWARMAADCLEDLMRYGGLPPAGATTFWDRTCLFVVTPVIDDGRFLDQAAYGLGSFHQRLAASVLPLIDLPIPADRVFGVPFAHAGTAVALGQAHDIIAAGRADRAIVLACDSCAEPLSAQWLERQGRLKSDEAPVGLIPGEAAACFLVETEPAARGRGARPEALITGWSAATEPANLFSDARNTGLGLASVGAAALDSEPAFAGDLIVDLNGETWRAYELGCALARLGSRIDETARTVLLCDSLGEIGAASGCAGVCLAVRSFARGYAAAERALVLSSSEYGYVGAIQLRRVDAALH